MSEEESEAISDELISRVAVTLLPITHYKIIAHHVLGLTLDQLDAQYSSSELMVEPIYRCLRLAVERQRINTPDQLRAVLEKAPRNDVISRDAVKYLETLDKQNMPNMRKICVEVAKYILPSHKEALFCGYFGLALQEMEQQQPEPVDHRTVCIRILSLWRRLNHGHNSATHLMKALETAAKQQRELKEKERNRYDDSEEEEYFVEAKKIKKEVEDITVYDEIIATMKRITEAVNHGQGSMRSRTPNMLRLNSDLPPIELLRLRLKDRYTDSYHTLNPLPWVSSIPASVLNEVFITLYVDEEGKEESQSSVISMNDLFIQQRRDYGGPAKRILLHGEAGSGKTTLTAKIALDWATGETHIKKLLDFTVVFVIKASLIEEGDTLNTYIERECVPNITAHMNIEKELCYDNILLVIDGYDEKRSKRDFVKDLVAKKRIMVGSTIVLTSRYGATQDVRHDFHLHVGLRGLSPDDIKLFVQKYADDKTKQNFLEMYAVNHPFIYILANPLYLWMFVLLGDEYFKDIQTFTRTDFYRQSLEGICDKAKHRLCENSDIDDKAIDTATDRLCAVANTCMRGDTLQITNESSINGTMAKLGLLNASISRSGIRDKRVYLFAHKTITEFLTAKHIAYVAEASSNDTGDTVIKSLLSFPEVQDEERRKASMVMLFVAGLLQNDRNVITNIIQKLVPEANENSDHTSHLLSSLLCEVDDTEWIPSDLIDGKLNCDLMLNQVCTPYCMRGVEKSSRIKMLEEVGLNEYPTYPTSPIATQACRVTKCLSSVVVPVMSFMDKDHLKELRIESVTLTPEQYSAVMSSVAECGRLRYLVMKSVNLDGELNNVTPDQADFQPLDHLTISAAPTLITSLTRLYWAKTQQLELEGLELSDDDITNIVETVHLSTASHNGLILKSLPNNGICKLLKGLVTTDCVQTLRELEVWCISDEDCEAVGDFVVECKKMAKFSWRNRVVEEEFSDEDCINFNVSESALRSMWEKISTRATHLHLVVMQEYTNMFDGLFPWPEHDMYGDDYGDGYDESGDDEDGGGDDEGSKNDDDNDKGVDDDNTSENDDGNNGMCVDDNVPESGNDDGDDIQSKTGDAENKKGSDGDDKLNNDDNGDNEISDGGDDAGSDNDDGDNGMDDDVSGENDKDDGGSKMMSGVGDDKWGEIDVDMGEDDDVGSKNESGDNGMSGGVDEEGDESDDADKVGDSDNGMGDDGDDVAESDDVEDKDKSSGDSDELNNEASFDSNTDKDHENGGSCNEHHNIAGVSGLQGCEDGDSYNQNEVKIDVSGEAGGDDNDESSEPNEDGEQPKRDRSDSVMLSVLRDLSFEQREAIRWTNIHIIHPHHQCPVSDEQCKELYQLLPSVQLVGNGYDYEDMNVVEK